MAGNAVIRSRRDTAANWTSQNPTLALGEIGVETDSLRLKVGDGSTAWASLPYLSESNTGWGRYTHTGATQAISASTATTLVNDKGSVDEAQKPLDVATFYDGTKIIGRNGDDIDVRVDLIFTPDDGTASEIKLWIDIGTGGSPVVVFPVRFDVVGGALVGHEIAYEMFGFNRATWAANGGVLKVQADGPGVISSVVYVIRRNHRAR